MKAAIYFSGATVADVGWTSMTHTQSSAETLEADDGSSPGWSAQWATKPQQGTATSTYADGGTGDLSWVVAGVLDGARARPTSGVWAVMSFTGLDNSKTYNVRCCSSEDIDGRITAWRVNGGGAEIEITNSDGAGGFNTTESADFTEVSPTGGEITVGFSNADSSDGDSYASAIQIEEIQGPSITLNNATRTPGQTLTGTATNYTSAPTTVILSDGASPDYEPTPTIAADGDNYAVSVDIEDFAAQAKAAGEGVPVQGLIPGTITVTVE